MWKKLTNRYDKRFSGTQDLGCGFSFSFWLCPFLYYSLIGIIRKIKWYVVFNLCMEMNTLWTCSRWTVYMFWNIPEDVCTEGLSSPFLTVRMNEFLPKYVSVFYPQTFYIVATTYTIKFVVYVYIYLYTHTSAHVHLPHTPFVVSSFGLTEYHSVS